MDAMEMLAKSFVFGIGFVLVMLLAIGGVLVICLTALQACQYWRALCPMHKSILKRMALCILITSAIVGFVRFTDSDRNVPIEQTIEAKVVYLPEHDDYGRPLPGMNLDMYFQVEMEGKTTSLAPSIIRLSLEDTRKMQLGDRLEIDIAHAKYTGQLLYKGSRLKR